MLAAPLEAGRGADDILATMTGQDRAPSTDDGVDVLIPVYGAADELDECLRSVERHTPTTPHLVTLVIDGPQPDAVEEVLRAIEDSSFPFAVTRLEKRGEVVRREDRWYATGS